MRLRNDPPLTRRGSIRARFWFEILLGVFFASLLIFTIAAPNWIEFVFRVDPDGGSGALEWLILAILAGVAVLNLGLARVEWRRARRPSRIAATDQR